jgi:hypothetical protein
MAPLYARFLARIPAGGHILDAGCGSGRDALAFRRLGRALKPDGLLYASFKYRAGELEHGGRRFTDLDEKELDAMVGAVQGLVVVETWVTGDRREGRERERWLNAMVREGIADTRGSSV